MKLIFMGTPDFAVPVLEKLVEERHNIGYVVTQPDRARNRGKVTFSPVKKAAVDCGISVLQPENINKASEEKEKMKEFDADAIIVVAYGQILKRDILDMPKVGCFNVHGSLLPKLRGAAPIQQAILQGDKRTGVTIMKMEEGLDSGDMISKAETEIGDKNFKDIHDELSLMGAELMAETLTLIENGQAKYEKQDESIATYAPRIEKKDGAVDFTKSAFHIQQKIRAFDPWPGAFCRYNGANMKLWKAVALRDNVGDNQDAGVKPEKRTLKKAVPGAVLSADSTGIIVKCGEGYLNIEELQLPGKKRVRAADFIRGHKIEIGKVLE